MEFIEARLYWEGAINRSDLERFFGVSTPQASADLQRYQKLAPHNVHYDWSAKRYVPTAGFRPLFLSPDAETYLRQLEAIATGLTDPQNCFAGWIPHFDVVPLPGRRIEPQTLFRTLRAIRRHQRLLVCYQSVEGPLPIWRWLSPHALGFNGFRWHMRAYCHARNEFRDFLFSRILEIADETSSDVDTSSDREWHEHVTLRVGPNPQLGENTRKMIELEYGMQDGELSIRVRGALYFYLCRSLGLDEKRSSELPEAHQLVALNRAEVDASLAMLRARSAGRG